jgi:dihydropteroate synthase
MTRLVRPSGPSGWRSEIDRVGADPGAWERISLKNRILAVATDPVCCAAANILKQCMLSAGADALVARGCIDGTAQPGPAVVFGTPSAIARGCLSLRGQPFALGSLADEIEAVLREESAPAARSFRHRSGVLDLSRGPVVMGILNVTPDSFSDGGLFTDAGRAVGRALEMESQGAALVDVGAESTRPGSLPVPPEVQIRRLLPVIGGIRETSGIPLSVDTSSPEVAAAALEAGADAINDTTALSSPGMATLAASAGAGVVLMHMKGTPKDMQESPSYGDPVSEVMEMLSLRRTAAILAGIPAEALAVDPGIGFGKRLSDNLAILARLGEFRSLGSPVVAGFSRKSLLGAVTGVSEPALRDPATHALAALLHDDTDILRVHDVGGAVQALAAARALRNGG